MNTAVMFSKASDEWSTPDAFYSTLDNEFLFSIDAAASSKNHKCDDWFGPGGSEEDALSCDWPSFTTYWLNPPYSRCREFLEKASYQPAFGSVVVCLVPSRTDTRWWHDYVWDAGQHQPKPNVEIRFIKGRLRFGGASAGAPFPSCVVIFRSTE